MHTVIFQLPYQNHMHVSGSIKNLSFILCNIPGVTVITNILHSCKYIIYAQLVVINVRIYTKY